MEDKVTESKYDKEPTPTSPLEIDCIQYEIPTTYSLSNKLIYMVVQEYIRTNILNESTGILDVPKIKLDLSALLFEHLKCAFTKVEITLEENKLKGLIEYTGGLPIGFELEHRTLIK